MFLQKKSRFLPGMITGTLLGVTVGAGCLMATDKKKMNKIKKSVGAYGKKLADQMHISA